MSQGEILARMEQKVDDLIIVVGEVKTKMNSLSCSANQEELGRLDERLKPIERIFWRLVITCIVSSAVFGSISAVIAGLVGGK